MNLNIKAPQNKKTLFIMLLSVSIILLLTAALMTACANKWVGSFGGKSSSGKDIIVTIKDDGTATYQEGSYEPKIGKWSPFSNDSLQLDFNRQVSSKSEPLIVNMSTDGNTITVSSENSGWTTDTYYRIK